MTRPRYVLDEPQQLVAAALRVKLANELGQHRAARAALVELAGLAARLRPALDTLAAGGSDDPACGLADILEERWPAAATDPSDAIDHLVQRGRE